jgi:uncharacterized membrane protein
MKLWSAHPRKQFLYMLLLSTFASVLLFAVGAYRNRTLEFAYLIWNLFLAWLPLLLAAWLVKVLRHKLWSSWEALLVSLLWIAFLPNSFYMVSDFIHLQNLESVDILYDSVMFTSFIFVGLVLGLSSLYLIHNEFRRRFSLRSSSAWLGGIFFLCGFAVYLGRDLRWNSWDILTNPGGLIFDISDRVLHPSAYPQMFITTLTFFLLISSMYGLTYKAIQLIRQTSDDVSI